MAPNPIDFDKVFAEFGKLGETGNFVVLSFVCVVFGLYAFGLVIARRADKKDGFEVNTTYGHAYAYSNVSCQLAPGNSSVSNDFASVPRISIDLKITLNTRMLFPIFISYGCYVFLRPT